jgi:hypothetical protein
MQPKSNKVFLSLAVSGFIWFMLFSLGIFGFDYFPVPERFLITGVYSLFTLITLLINLFVLQDKVLKNNSFFAVITWTFWLTFCIGNSNFFVTTILFKYEPVNLFVYVKNVIFVFMLGPLIIVPFVILISYVVSLKQQLKQTEVSVNNQPKNQEGKEDEKITFLSEYKNDSFSVRLNDLLFIKSADNYVDVWYNDNNQISHKFVRNKLSNIPTTQYPDLVRSHRCYIVNKQNIKAIQGNSLRYSISIHGINEKIPLSKNFKCNFF